MERDSFPLEIRERLENIKRMRKLIQSLGGTIEKAKDQIAKAQNAEQLAQLMLKSLYQGIDIPNAFKREDMDCPIDLKIGNKKKGLRHIIERRTEDGTLSIISEKELFEAIALAVIEGDIRKIREKDSSQALEVFKGETSAILIKEKEENAWMLTGWTISKERLKELAKLPPGERRSALFNSAPTHISPTTSRTNVGAGDSFSSNDTTSTDKAQNNLSSEQRRNNK